jgi:hypothetical protein
MGCGYPAGEGPSGASVAQAEDGRSGEVEDGGSGQDIGEDAGLAAAAGFASAPAAPHEVGDLAFDGGSGGPVGLPPGGVLLRGAGGLQDGRGGVRRCCAQWPRWCTGPAAGTVHSGL